MDALMLDGNSIAGLLEELFGADMTTAIGVCDGCGASEPIGALHVYRGAGIVVRCPHCTNVLAKVVKTEGRVWMSLAGVRTLELTPP